MLIRIPFIKRAYFRSCLTTDADEVAHRTPEIAAAYRFLFDSHHLDRVVATADVCGASIGIAPNDRAAVRGFENGSSRVDNSNGFEFDSIHQG